MGNNKNGINSANQQSKPFVASRFKFLVFSLCGTCFIFLFLTSRDLYTEISEKKYTFAIKSRIEDGFTIMTEGCSIPAINALDDSVKKFVKRPNVTSCLDPALMPVDHNETHMWIKSEFKKHYEKSNDVSLKCCYRHFSRPASIQDINSRNVDNRVEYAKCINFTNTIAINEKHEFVKVNCDIKNSTLEQFFLFAPKKKFISHTQNKEIKANGFNVLVMGIDAVSRLNFYRTMPKTIKFLKERSVVDLSGYNKVGDNTFPNLVPMLLGVSSQELINTCLPYKTAKFDNCPFIWEWYKQTGSYTALGEDSSWLGTFNYLRGGFSVTPTDYYMHTFINEAEKYVKKTGNTKLCVNDKYLYKILLDYIINLTHTLKSSRFFGFFWEITMSHDYLNYPMVMDNDYENFFKKLEKSKYLDNTVVFLVSDHGIRWGDIRRTKQGRIEERLPFVFLLVPPIFREKYSKAFENLQINSKRLTTPYDVHATLFDLIDLKSIENEIILQRSQTFYGNDRSISLFLPIPGNRTCATAHISDHWCTCHKDTDVSKSSKEAIDGSSYLVSYLNSLVKDYSECANLTLQEIIDVTEMIVGKPSNKKELNSWREFLIIIKTLPGDGMFESTVRNDGGQWSVSGTVSRLNLYGNQSRCVDDNTLKLYCFCK